jgi:diguanylate cyclase (GGDEF)-like protein
MPDTLSGIEVSPGDAALPAEEKRALAESMLLGYRYRDLKALVVEDVDDCTTDLINELRRRQLAADKEVDTLLLALLVIAIVDVAAVSLAMLANYLLVMRPLRNHVHRIEHNEPLDMIGAREIRTLAGAYNHIYEENHRRTMLLRHEAETDALTGLLNRGSYDRVLKHQGRDIALVLVDVDLFKQINDKWGHEVGDEVLRRVARALREHFRSTDYLCRIGGDEFAVILTEVGTEMRRMIAGKLDSIYESLDEAGDGVPAISLSSGIAFSATLPEGIGLYHAADHALYEAKRRGRHQFAFYEGE